MSAESMRGGTDAIAGELRVGSMMVERVVTVEMDDRLSVVKEIFDNTRFHHLLVTERGRLCGVVSDRDLLKAISPRIGLPVETAKDLATLNKRVHQIMSRELVTVTADATLLQALEVFLDNAVSCLPVVDAEHRPRGVLSWRDVFAALRDHLRDGGSGEAA